MNTSLPTIRKLVFFLVLVTSMSCNNAFFERGTVITIITSKPSLVFKLTGSGIPLRIFIQGPYNEITEAELSAKMNLDPLWELSPPPNKTFELLPEIHYGIIPPEFQQVRPANGPPQPLKEGGCYTIIVPTSGAKEGNICLCIKEGEAKIIACPK